MSHRLRERRGGVTAGSPNEPCDSPRLWRMIIYLIRHGQSDHNRDGLTLGRADVPLTPFGREQVAALGRRLAHDPLDRVIASPLARAKHTAESVAGPHGLTVETRDELLELDIGETEGLAFEEMRREYAEFLREWLGPEAHRVRMPGGESLDDLALRLAPLLDELRDAKEAAVALVSHNFTLRAAICLLLGVELSAFRNMAIDLASLTTLQTRGSRVTVRSLNDTCHLQGLEPSSTNA